MAGFVLIRWTPVADYLTEEYIVATLGRLRLAWWSPLLLIALYAVVSPMGLPVSPLLLGGGAVFGFVSGSLYNMIGLLVGATLSYFVAKLLGRDFIVHIAGRRLQRVERLFQRHGFWPLVQTRFLPIPFSVVNYGAALAGITPPRFLLATAVGLIPATVMHTYFVSKLFEPGLPNPERGIVLLQYLAAMAIFNALISLPSIREWWRRRKRHREVTANRRSRRRRTDGESQAASTDGSQPNQG
ncbi:MAG: TVP38/TMEM64 family protein [bacterium]|nr:TVP38/TMEM64 family protein [bacterium]